MAVRRLSKKGSAAAVPKGERTRAHLINTALELFETKGFDRTTLRDIAGRAKVSLGLLYRYFPSKDALVIELYERLSREFEERASAMPQGAWLTRFAALLRISLEVLGPHREALRAMIPALTVAPGHPLFIPGGQPSHVRVEAKFVEAVKCATDLPPDAQTLGRRLYLMHLVLVLGWLIDRSEAQAASFDALSLVERWTPLFGPLLASPMAANFLEPFGVLLERAALGTSSSDREICT
jgi:AcrR family transcriptional regulator